MANEFFAIIEDKIVFRNNLNIWKSPNGITFTTMFMPQFDDERYIENKYSNVVNYMITYFKNKYNDSSRNCV